MLHSYLFLYTSKQLHGHLFEIIIFTKNICINLKSLLGRYFIGALLIQTWEVFHMAGAFDVLNILQASMHAWHFEYIVGIWKFKAWQPMPTPLFKKCDITASKCTSVHGIGIVVLNKFVKCAKTLKRGSLQRHVHTKATWSPWSAFISFFNWTWYGSWIVVPSQQMGWQHVQPLRVQHCVLVIQNTRSTFAAQSQQQAMKYQRGVKWITNSCCCFNSM